MVSSGSSRASRLLSSVAACSKCVARRNLTAARAIHSSTRVSRLPSASVSKPPFRGQPLPYTHPHLLKKGELTPGITYNEYESRRKKLMDGLEDGSIVISQAGKIVYASKKIFYKFRQATDFLYLTGFHEPDAVLVLEKNSSSPRGFKMTMFVEPMTDHFQLWDGGRSGLDGATSIFGADEALPLSRLETFFQRHILSSEGSIYMDLTDDEALTKTGLWKKGSIKTNHFGTFTASRVKSLMFQVEKLRKLKSPAEVALMRAAGELSAKAHTEVMRFSSAGKTEAQLQAHFEYVCAMGGSQRPAYVPVVASGYNALVIHYTNNDCVLNNGELVLIDAGCELDGYASDISRTFPVSGRFSDPQRDLYQAVLNVQKESIKRCTEQFSNTMGSLHNSSRSMLRQELRQIGLDLTDNELTTVYPHSLSHFTGMDLHDTSYHSERTSGDLLVAGNVITIEPGIYVPNDSRFPAHFHGIGIRIEDDVVIGETDPYILSSNAPKEIVDVEGACQDLLRRADL